MYFPMDTIDFDCKGRFEQKFYNDNQTVKEISRTDSDIISEVTLEEDGGAYEDYLTFFINSSNTQLDSLYVRNSIEGDGDAYLYSYNEKHEVVSIKDFGYIFDVSKDDFVMTTNEYKVTYYVYDEMENWTSRTVTDKSGKHYTQSRSIEYYDLPKLIAVSEKGNLYCKVPFDNENCMIMNYNAETKKWSNLLPLDYADAPYGYKDCQLKDSHISLVPINIC
jgi:hypothetical protein